MLHTFSENDAQLILRFSFLQRVDVSPILKLTMTYVVTVISKTKYCEYRWLAG